MNTGIKSQFLPNSSIFLDIYILYNFFLIAKTILKYLSNCLPKQTDSKLFKFFNLEVNYMQLSSSELNIFAMRIRKYL